MDGAQETVEVVILTALDEEAVKEILSRVHQIRRLARQSVQRTSSLQPQDLDSARYQFARSLLVNTERIDVSRAVRFWLSTHVSVDC